VSRLEARGAAGVVDLGRLGRADVTAMKAATSVEAGVTVPPELASVVAERSEGLPLLVEELLSVSASGMSARGRRRSPIPWRGVSTCCRPRRSWS
jgi:hypothetical protein